MISYTEDELKRLPKTSLIEISKASGIQCSEHDSNKFLIDMILRYNVYTYQELVKTDPRMLLKLTDEYVYEKKTESFYDKNSQYTSKDQVIKSIIEKQIQNHPKLCKDEIITFQKYQNNSNLFNRFLSIYGGFPNQLNMYKYVTKHNMETLVCLNMLDTMLRTANEWGDDWTNTVFYRGINEVEKNIITTLIKFDSTRADESFQLLKAEYCSCNIDKFSAIKFADLSSACCVLQFEIPEDVKYYNTIKGSTRGRHKGTRNNHRAEPSELVLQRNIVFDAFIRTKDFVDGIEVIDCRIRST